MALNSRLNMPIACDETGGGDPSDSRYRIAGWDTLLSGGAVYDNLDYSFTVGHEDGTDIVDAPGGGGAELRNQLGVLARFFNSLDFVQMKPDTSVIKGGIPDSAQARALVKHGETYVIYLRSGGQVDLELELPAAHYTAEWIDTTSGESVGREIFEHAGGQRTIRSPMYSVDIALCVRRN